MGVKLGKPGTSVGVNVAAESAGPLVAVLGVVVRLGCGVTVLATAVLVGVAEEASAIRGVAVSGTGVIVGEG